MSDATTPLRPTAKNPPLQWLTTDPEWFDRKAGKGIVIQTDPEHPEAGRFAGFVSPPGGERCYMKTPGRCIPTPTGSPDGFRTFHADTDFYPDIDGSLVEIEIGTVALGRGHSNPLQATTPEASKNWLARKERWAALAGDIALYGHITDTPEGLLLRGHVAPLVSIAEADMINKTVMSGEWLPDPELNGELVFAGVARIDRTALPMRDLPMAASLEDCGCDSDTAVAYTFAPADMATMEERPPMPPETESPEPVRAGPEEDIAELRATVADLETRLERAEAEVAALGALAVEDEAATTRGPGQSLDDLVELVTRQGNELSAMREQLAAQSADRRQEIETARRETETTDGSAISSPAATGAGR